LESNREYASSVEQEWRFQPTSTNEISGGAPGFQDPIEGKLRLLAVYRMWYTLFVGKKARPLPRSGAQSETLGQQGKRVPAIFYRTEAGREPLREWLKGLPAEDRKRIGEDIKTVEFGWPIGMPACRPLGNGIHEVRTSLAQNRIARVLFYIDKRGRMVLIHGFIKKTQKTPDEDLKLARSNKNKHERGLQ